MISELDKPLYALTVGEYITLNRQLFSEQTSRENINSKKFPDQEKNDILIGEASKLTELSVPTIRTKCHLNQIPYYKPEGTKYLRFKRDELKAWMASRKINSQSEADQEMNQYLISKRKKS
jgi:excisionase family DNA binding protein